MSWMLYTPGVTMTAEGVRLAGHTLLEYLEKFESSVLASYGYTSLPLMSASVILSNRRYTGLIVNDSPAANRPAVEGAGCPPGPVVIVDDSLVTGTSFYRAARQLEQQGFAVEGLLCLVEFAGRGGRAWAESLGYRVEAVFSLDQDLEPSRLESAGAPPPGSPSTCADGLPLDPLTVAQRIVEAWPGHDLIAEQAVCPHGPATHAGAIVAVRERDTERLIVRDGTVRPAGGFSCSSLAGAAAQAIMRRSGHRLRSHGLDRLDISVTLLTAKEIAPREIDAASDGVAVQSRIDPGRVGYSLRDGRARTEMEAYLAAQQMAGLGQGEPHVIYACTEDERTQRGTGRFERTEQGTAAFACVALRRATEAELPEALMTALGRLAWAQISGVAVPGAEIAGCDAELACSGAGVGWYEDGRLLGCWLSWSPALGVAVRRAADRAWQRSGRPQQPPLAAQRLTVLITVLFEPRDLGELDAAAAAAAFDLGVETLVAASGKRSAAVFPHFACHYGWSGRQTAQLALRKAGIGGTGPARWSAYRTASWLDGPNGRFPIDHGFPARSAAGPPMTDRFRRSACAVAQFIAGSVGCDGLPVYAYDPLTDTVIRDGPVGRIIFALDALAEAASLLRNEGWKTIAEHGLHVCLERLSTIDGRVRLDVENRPSSTAAECELVAALAAWLPQSLEEPMVRVLAGQVRKLFKRDGMISDLALGFRIATDHDILPGVALVGLGKCALRTGIFSEIGGLDAHLAWYRRRFRLARSWAMVGWQMQGWSIVSDCALVDGARDFVFELADWAASWQLDKNGAFLTDLAVGPSFHTACVAEGIVEAWRLAIVAGDPDRTKRYADCWQRSCDFMAGLTIDERDGLLLPNPARAIGGVRPLATDSRLRIDYAAHVLRALVRGVAVGDGLS